MHISRMMARHLLVVIIIALSLGGCASIKKTMKASPSLMNAMGLADIPIKDLEKKYTNKESKWLEVNGTRIHYRDVGEGHPVVLVHGIMSSLHTWDGWVEEMRKSYRVITLDVPSYGLTGVLPDDMEFSDEALVSLFAQFVDELELNRFSVAGNSLGGYIAATYAAQFPERVAKLILLDPVGYPQTTPWIFDVATAPGMSTLGRFVAPPLLVTLNVEDVYGDPTRMTKETLQRYIYMSQRPGAKSAYMDTMIALKARSTAQVPVPFFNIKAPTLLMWGESDRWVPVDLAKRWQADVPNLKLITYPGVGHMPMEEIPDQTVEDAIVFLADLGRRPSTAAIPEPEAAAPEKSNLESILQGGFNQPSNEAMEEMEEMAPMEF